MDHWKEIYGFNVVSAGRNWNSLRLLTGVGAEKEGHRLAAIDIRFKGDTVLIVLKKDSPKGPMVAFLEAMSLEDVLFVVASAIKSKAVPWKPDKFRSMRSDKT
jgi:hypothetical protein